MCLALFRFDPTDKWPFLLASIRDEDLARPAEGAAQRWPDSHPGVIGGRDVRGGGTWLAVDPGRRTAAAVFTPPGATPPGPGNRSRGELPLLALSRASLDSLDLTPYLPFALLQADAVQPAWWSWNGSRLERSAITPGIHVANVDGLDATDRSPRQASWLPRFSSTVPAPFRPGGQVADRWQRWLRLLDDGLEPERADSLLLRISAPSGSYGTRSVALIAIGRADLVYDVTDQPGTPGSWTTVPLP